MDRAACSPSWRSLNDDMLWGKESGASPRSLEVSEKKIKRTERKGIRIFLSPAEQAAYQSTIIFAGPFLLPPPPSALKIISLMQVQSKWLSCSLGQTLGHRRKVMWRGRHFSGDLRLPDALMQFSKQPCAGVMLSLPPSFTCGFIVLPLTLELMAKGNVINGVCAVHDPFCIWRRSLAKKKVASWDRHSNPREPEKETTSKRFIWKEYDFEILSVWETTKSNIVKCLK